MYLACNGLIVYGIQQSGSLVGTDFILGYHFEYFFLIVTHFVYLPLFDGDIKALVFILDVDFQSAQRAEGCQRCPDGRDEPFTPVLPEKEHADEDERRKDDEKSQQERGEQEKRYPDPESPVTVLEAKVH